MEITTNPVCRYGWQGQTLRYVVRAEDATEVLVAEECAEGMRARVVETRQVGNGIEADLEVEVLNSKAY